MKIMRWCYRVQAWVDLPLDDPAAGSYASMELALDALDLVRANDARAYTLDAFVFVSERI